MARVRIMHAQEGVFLGPAPATTGHFINHLGVINNNYNDLINNYNLVQKVDRIQSISYSIDSERKDIAQLGTRSLAARPVLTSPTIKLNFDYCLNGVKNELRLGFLSNYAQYQGNLSGTPYYPSPVCPISGLVSRSYARPTGAPYWPLDCRDKRNIFIPLAREGTELRANEFYENFSSIDQYPFSDPNASGYSVAAFGGCYLDSYSNSAQIGGVPQAAVSFVCDNLAYLATGSGAYTPVVNLQTRQPISGNHFVIPKTRKEGGPSILMPGDITISVSSTGDAGLNNFGFDWNDIKIQSYTFGFSLARQSLDSLGYKLPLDRVITFPVIVGISFDMIQGDSKSGNMVDLFNRDYDYNISIKLKNPACLTSGNASNPRNSGPFTQSGQIAAQYDFTAAKFKGSNSRGAIGANKMVSANFETEISMDDNARGFYLSGLLNIEKVEDFLMTSSGTYVLGPGNLPIVIGYPPLY